MIRFLYSYLGLVRFSLCISFPQIVHFPISLPYTPVFTFFHCLDTFWWRWLRTMRLFAQRDYERFSRDLRRWRRISDGSDDNGRISRSEGKMSIRRENYSRAWGYDTVKTLRLRRRTFHLLGWQRSWLASLVSSYFVKRRTSFEWKV